MQFIGISPYVVLVIFAVQMIFYAASGGVLLAKNREQHDRSRLYIGILFVALSLGSFNFILTALFRTNPQQFLQTILEPYPLMISFAMYLLLPAYIMEMVHPHWMTVRRVFILLAPWLATCIAFVVWHGLHGWAYAAITHLSSPSDIPTYIHQPDVILRLLLAFFFIPAGLSSYFMPYNWRLSNITLRWQHWLLLLSLLTGIGFVLGMGLRISWAMHTYLIILDALAFLVIYIELKERIPVPQEPTVLPKSDSSKKDVVLSPLARQIQEMLDQNIWQNPDMQRSDICEKLGTNRTYLSRAEQELGYANFAEMINRQRVAYIKNMLDAHTQASLSDIFFQAGFRNRTTATRCFQQQYHCTPSEYVAQHR